MGMADDAEETPVAYGPTPGRSDPYKRERDLKCELLMINAEIEAWAHQAASVDDNPPVEMLRRKFELEQALVPRGWGAVDD